MSMTAFDFAGIIGLVLALLSRKFRQFLVYCVHNAMFAFVRKTYLHRSLGDALIANLTRKGYKIKRFKGELYGEDPAFIRSENEVKHILYRDFHGSTQLFWGKGWPIMISGSPLTYHKDTVKNYSYIVYSFRWTTDIVKTLDDATEGKNEAVDEDEEGEVSKFCVKRVSGGQFILEKDRKTDPDGQPRRAQKEVLVSEALLADPFSAYVPLKWSKNDIGQVIYHNTLEMMSLNQELEDVLDEVKFWFNSREFYEERGIPWKRGLLFYGKPGTGKTLFSRALAEHLNMPLIVFDLATMDNTEFVHAWSQILPKRIVLFEDFDTIFDKRVNICGSGMTFEAILNCLDGADKKQGVLTIITTNHPERLDPALGGAEDDRQMKGKMPSRPGRIDRSVEFLPLDYKGRVKLAMRIVKNEELAEKLVKQGEYDSAAQLQERCFRAAVEILFKKRMEIGKREIPVEKGMN
jgi:ATPase family associated with various cellular activities (AAA)